MWVISHLLEKSVQEEDGLATDLQHRVLAQRPDDLRQRLSRIRFPDQLTERRRKNKNRRQKKKELIGNVKIDSEMGNRSQSNINPNHGSPSQLLMVCRR